MNLHPGSFFMAASLVFAFASCTGDDPVLLPGDTANSDGGGVDGGATDAGGGDSPIVDSGSDTSDSGGEAGPGCAPGGGGGPTGGPADLFPCNNPYDKNVSALAPSAASSGIIAACSAAPGLRVDFGHQVLHADASTPASSFAIGLPSDADNVPVPIPAGGALEDETGYACAGGGDCRLIVVDDANKKLYEAVSANLVGTSWSADNLARWDLSKPYGALGRGANCASSDPAGLPVAAGLIGIRETKATSIRHTLRITLPSACVRTGVWVAPATHGSGTASNPTAAPFGTRLRLRSTFDVSTLPSPGAKAVATALKTYGALLSDVSITPILWAESDRFPKVADASLSWQGLLGGNDLVNILPSDFEVVDLGTVETATATCVRAP